MNSHTNSNQVSQQEYEEPVVKSKNQLKNEVKRKEKTEKFLAKQEKLLHPTVDESVKKNQSKGEPKKLTTSDIPVLDILEGEFKGNLDVT